MSSPSTYVASEQSQCDLSGVSASVQSQELVYRYKGGEREREECGSIATEVSASASDGGRSVGEIGGGISVGSEGEDEEEEEEGVQSEEEDGESVNGLSSHAASGSGLAGAGSGSSEEEEDEGSILTSPSCRDGGHTRASSGGESESDFSAVVSDYGGSAGSSGDLSAHGASQSRGNGISTGAATESSYSLGTETSSNGSTSNGSLLSDAASTSQSSISSPHVNIKSKAAKQVTRGSGKDKHFSTWRGGDSKLSQGVVSEDKSSATVTEHPLLTATKSSDVSTVRRLLQKGSTSDLRATDAHRRTALHMACSFGRLDVASLLIDMGSDVEAVSLAGQTPLHEACIGGHYSIIRRLISEVSDLDAVDSNGLSAAHYCSLNGECACLELLCDQGCDICLEDKLNRSTVHLAAMKDHAGVIQCLIGRGMELETVDNKGKTPTHYAAQHGSLQCLKLLDRSAVEINSKDTSGLQPVHEAASNNRLDCLRYLVKRVGKAISAIDKEGQNVLHKAAECGALECVHWLLENGARPNEQDKRGFSALHLAASTGEAECFRCLLQHEADPKLLTKDSGAGGEGETPMGVARRCGKPRVIDKAVDGTRRCRLCDRQQAMLKKQEAIKPSPFTSKMASHRQNLFAGPPPSSPPPLSFPQAHMATGSKPHWNKSTPSQAARARAKGGVATSGYSEHTHHVVDGGRSNKGMSPKDAGAKIKRSRDTDKLKQPTRNLAAKYYGPIS